MSKRAWAQSYTDAATLLAAEDSQEDVHPLEFAGLEFIKPILESVVAGNF